MVTEVLPEPTPINNQNNNNQFQSELHSNHYVRSPTAPKQVNTMLQSLSTTKELNGSINDHNSMPLIVNVEENVYINDINGKGPEKFLSNSQRPLTNQVDSPIPTRSISSSPYSRLYQSPSPSNLTVAQPKYNPYHQTSYSNPSPCEKTRELTPPTNYDKQSKIVSSSNLSSTNNNSFQIDSTTMPFTRIPNKNPSVVCATHSKPESCYLPCCHPPPSYEKSVTSVTISPDEKRNYLQHTGPTTSHSRASPTLKSTNSTPTIQRKQRQLQANPYPITKPVAPRTSTPVQNSFKSETKNSNNVYHSIPQTVVQHSSTIMSPPITPNDLSLSNTATRSIDISQAIAQHGRIDLDKVPRLLVRHTKVYPNRKIDTLGQLFPTWFNEPDYRCIHCFTCDQVFTPQHFMTHVDDEKLVNIKALSMTPIQLLASEKLSENKIELWNEFCASLSNYTRKGQISGFCTSEDA